MTQRRRYAGYYPNGMRRWFADWREAFHFAMKQVVPQVMLVQVRTEHEIIALFDGRPPVRGKCFIFPVSGA